MWEWSHILKKICPFLMITLNWGCESRTERCIRLNECLQHSSCRSLVSGCSLTSGILTLWFFLVFFSVNCWNASQSEFSGLLEMQWKSQSSSEGFIHNFEFGRCFRLSLLRWSFVPLGHRKLHCLTIHMDLILNTHKEMCFQSDKPSTNRAAHTLK